MSTQHHGNGERSDLIKRFNQQQTGKYERTFPNGRTGADDDGDFTYSIATDDRHRTIVIRFAHPIEWIGLSVKEAEELRDNLTDRLLVLRGVTT